VRQHDKGDGGDPDDRPSFSLSTKKAERIKQRDTAASIGSAAAAAAATTTTTTSAKMADPDD